MAKGYKTGGRKKGTPNKTTSEIRKHYQYLISSNLPQLQSDLLSLEPLQRLRMIIELSKFVLPTLRATDISLNDDKPNFQKVVIERVIKQSRE